MQTQSQAAKLHDHHPPGQAAAHLLLWILLGTAFVLSGYARPAGSTPTTRAPPTWPPSSGRSCWPRRSCAPPCVDLVRGHLHMDELVAIAVLAAMAQGDFRTAGVIAFFMLLSVVIETRTAEGAHAAIEGLMRLTPSTARRLLPDGAEESVPAAELSPGDRIRLLPGDNVPADGCIVARPHHAERGHHHRRVPPRREGAGGRRVRRAPRTSPAASRWSCRAPGAKPRSAASGELIMAAEQTRLPITRLIDRYLRLLHARRAHAGRLRLVLHRRLVPRRRRARRGLPLRADPGHPDRHGRRPLRAARAGHPRQERRRPRGGIAHRRGGVRQDGHPDHRPARRRAPRPRRRAWRPPNCLRAAAAAERFSRHPAARAMERLARETGLEPEPPAETHEEPGRGVRALVGAATVLCGRADWLAAQGAAPVDPRRGTRRTSAVIHVARGRPVAGLDRPARRTAARGGARPGRPAASCTYAAWPW